MIVRTHDAARVGAIFNHPSILPFVALGRSRSDVAALVENPENWCFVAEGGAWLFHRLGAGLYEGHAGVLPEWRGTWTRRVGLACLWELFVRSDAWQVVLRPAIDNPAAIAGCRMLGAHLEFVTGPRLPGRCGGMVAHHVYVLGLTRWLGVISGDDPRGYARFAVACPSKGDAVFRRFWLLSGRSEPCPCPSHLLD